MSLFITYEGGQRQGLKQDEWECNGRRRLRNANPSDPKPRVWPQPPAPQTARPLHHCLWTYGLEMSSEQNVEQYGTFNSVPVCRYRVPEKWIPETVEQIFHIKEFSCYHFILKGKLVEYRTESVLP